MQLKILTIIGEFMFRTLFSIILILKMSQISAQLDTSIVKIYSNYLHHDFQLRILKHQFDKAGTIIFFNDGQDFSSLQMEEKIRAFCMTKSNTALMVVGIDCGDRINEYGVSYQADYKNRGSKADLYEKFIIQELCPWLEEKYSILWNESKVGFAGFSLGGLSAFDITLRHPEIFDFCGVFSGSFWWRSKPFSPADPDGHRIMHEVIANSQIEPVQRFWLMAGTLDEDGDRNNNGIIDSIDDTLDIIKVLKAKGCQMGVNITYHEEEGGTHGQSTWSKVLPNFLNWIYQ